MSLTFFDIAANKALVDNSPPIQAVVAIKCPLYLFTTADNSSLVVGTLSIPLSV